MKQHIENIDNLVNIFWTGGWDSTFRLIQLVALERKKVQPIYVIDHNRQSLDIELRTMDQLRLKIYERYPEAQNLILPTRFYGLEEIRENKEITKKYLCLTEKILLGVQYDWLARLCYQEKIKNVELTIEKGAGSGVTDLIREFVISSEEKSGPIIIDLKYAGTDVFGVFHFFQFPILFSDKNDMKRIAEHEGFLDILFETWFCHFPTKDQEPCGECKPCSQVQKDGLGYRIPLKHRLRVKLKKILGEKSVIRIRSIKEGCRKAFRGLRFLHKKSHNYLILRNFFWSLRKGEMGLFFQNEMRMTQYRKEFYRDKKYILKKVFIAPKFPSYDFVFYRMMRILNMKFCNAQVGDIDFAIDWRLDTTRNIIHDFNFLRDDVGVINQYCQDISKEKVDRVFLEVFGYASMVDPAIFNGECILKSNINAMHDSVVIKCPINEKRHDMVYQRIINNRVSDSYYCDIRVPIIGKSIPVVFYKYRHMSERFIGGYITESKNVSDVFSKKEVEQILTFAELMGLDYGELDVLRDLDDYRIYIIDVNNTPFRIRNSKPEVEKEILMKMCEAFYWEFLYE